VRVILVALLAAAVSACGPDGDDAASTGGAGQGGSAANGGSGGASGGASNGGRPSSGGASGAGEASGGASGSEDDGGVSGTNGSAGTPTADCTGTFGEPALVMDAAAMRVGGLTLRADELELIYEDRPTDDTAAEHHFRRSIRTRKDEMFPPGETLDVLDAACEDSTWARSGELSNDGLRLYFGCYAGLTAEPQPIRLARRASLDEPFVLEEAPVGTSRSGLALDSDELMIVTSPAIEEGPLFAQTRATTSDVFGPAVTLIGLDGLLTPDLSSDGQRLFASRYTEVNRNSLVTAERTGPTTFSTALTIRQLDDPVAVVGSPTISADCHALYYVSVAAGPEYSIMVLRR
jgi:hypothetical protein